MAISRQTKTVLITILCTLLGLCFLVVLAWVYFTLRHEHTIMVNTEDQHAQIFYSDTATWRANAISPLDTTKQDNIYGKCLARPEILVPRTGSLTKYHYEQLDTVIIFLRNHPEVSVTPYFFTFYEGSLGKFYKGPPEMINTEYKLIGLSFRGFFLKKGFDISTGYLVEGTTKIHSDNTMFRDSLYQELSVKENLLLVHFCVRHNDDYEEKQRQLRHSVEYNIPVGDSGQNKDSLKNSVNENPLNQINSGFYKDSLKPYLQFLKKTSKLAMYKGHTHMVR